MQGRDFAAFLNLSDDLVVNQLAAHELLTAVNHPVSDGLDVPERGNRACLMVQKSVEDEFYALRVVRNGGLHDHLLLARGLMLQTTRLQADSFHKTLCKKAVVIVTDHIQQLVFQRRTAAIKNEDYHNLTVYMFNKILCDTLQSYKFSH